MMSVLSSRSIVRFCGTAAGFYRFTGLQGRTSTIIGNRIRDNIQSQAFADEPILLLENSTDKKYNGIQKEVLR